MLTYRLGFGSRTRMVLTALVVGVAAVSCGQLLTWAAFGPPGQGPWSSLVVCALLGVPFGLLIGVLEHRRLGALRSALDDRAPSREALRAANRGPVPQDGHTRHVARTLVGFALAERRRQRVSQSVAAAFAVVVGTLITLDGTGWGLALVALGALVVGWDRYRVARLRRRLALLPP